MKLLYTLIVAFFISCSTEPDNDAHPLVGVWLGTEREYYSVNEGDTSSVAIDSTNGSWTFYEDYMFAGWNEQSNPNVADTLSYTGIWSVLQNHLSITLTIGDDSETSIFDYIINNNLELTRKIYPLEDDSAYFEITILTMWRP